MLCVCVVCRFIGYFSITKVEMKFKVKKSFKTLSDKIADALTVKASADIEDDLVFGTKPKTLSRADFSSSESEDEAAISDFRKRNVNLLSEISKKYEGQVHSHKNENSLGHDFSESEVSNETVESDNEDTKEFASKDKTASESELSEEEDRTPKKSSKKYETASESGDGEESDDYSITQLKKQIADSDESSEDANEQHSDDNGEDDNEEGHDISQLDDPMPEKFEHMKIQNVSEEAKKGACVRNQLLLWEGLLEMRIHLQRCVATANQMPLPETYEQMKGFDGFDEECNVTKLNVGNVLDK